MARRTGGCEGEEDESPVKRKMINRKAEPVEGLSEEESLA